MTSVGSNLSIFCVDVHMELIPPPRPHASTWAWHPPSVWTP